MFNLKLITRSLFLSTLLLCLAACSRDEVANVPKAPAQSQSQTTNNSAQHTSEENEAESKNGLNENASTATSVVTKVDDYYVVNDEANLGEIDSKAQPVKVKIRWKNKSGKTLHDINVRPACRCEKAKIDKTELKPGETATIECELEHSSSRGYITTGAYLFHDGDKANPLFPSFTIFNTKELELSPGKIDFGTIELKSSNETQFDIIGISSKANTTCEFIRCEGGEKIGLTLEPGTPVKQPDEPRASFKETNVWTIPITAKLTAPSKAEAINEKVALVVKIDGVISKVEAVVSADCKASCYATPSQITAIIKKEGEFNRTLLIHSQDESKKLEIVSAFLKNANAKIKIAHHGSQVSIVGKNLSESIANEIVVTVNDGKSDKKLQLRIPIKVLVD